MVQGQELATVFRTIEEANRTKRDFRAPSGKLRMILEETERQQANGSALDAVVAATETIDQAREEGQKHLRFWIDGIQDGTFRPTRRFHSQLASAVKIPWVYYDRMATEAPDLLLTNVNHWLGQQGDHHLVRTLRGNARAFLGGRYRVVDNVDVASAALPALEELQAKGWQLDFQSSHVDDERMYIHVILPNLQAELKVERGNHTFVNEVLHAGILIRNNEVGSGAIAVEPMIRVLACLNGLITTQTFRRRHVGRGNGDLEEATEIFADDTQQADLEALSLKIRDTVRHACQEETFREQVAKITEVAGDPVAENPEQVVEAAAVEVGLNKDEQSSVLRSFIEKQDYTRWGLNQAVTQVANDAEDYDRAVELERLGGKILAMQGSRWNAIAQPSAA